jgi:long-subunit fatty acid transport protein
MKKQFLINVTRGFIPMLLFTFSALTFGQTQTTTPSVATKSDFWQHVQFGGGLGLNVGGGFTNIAVAPSAIYNVNKYFSVGAGLQGSYISVKNNYNSFNYGASLIGLVNPIEEIQLSVELEELKINTSYESSFGIPSKHFWNTGLFLGAGYRAENVTIGARYNVLFNKSDSVYTDAFMPFVRVYF